MRRAFPALAAVLLTAACASTTTHPAATPSADASNPTRSATVSPSVTAALASGAPAPQAQSGSPAPAATGASTGQLEVAVPAGRLPYKPAEGAPALDDVKIVKAADPCTIPADDSGNEAQLLDARMDVNVLVVTFEFTNPCSTPLGYTFHVTQAIGSATGKPGGPGVDATTAPIQPGRSISFNVNVDPDPKLDAAQLKQLWVGVTRIGKV